MTRKVFSYLMVFAIALSFFFTGGSALAEETTLADEAGIAAYAKLASIDLATVKPLFLTVEYQDEDFIVGKVDMGAYEPEYDPFVYVDVDGWIIAYYPPGIAPVDELDTNHLNPAAKIVDVMARTTNKTLLEKAVAIFAPTAVAAHFDFGNPDAESLLLVAEDKADGNEFTLTLPITATVGISDTVTFEYTELSYAFYQTYLASFTVDNEEIDQISFVTTNADFIGAGNYGTIFGHFGDEGEVAFPLGIENEFAVASGSLYAFGALAIEGDVTGYTIADEDFERVIPLVAPVDFTSPTFDFIPSAFTKNPITGLSLEPTLSWTASSVPSYEYCVDTTAPDADPETEDCSTGWKSTSETSVALSNLFFNTTYYWQVRAVNSFGTTYADLGVWASFTTEAIKAPAAFSSSFVLTEKDGAASRLVVTWNRSYGAYFYEVCIDKTAACVAPEVWHNVGLALTYATSELAFDTTYFVQVRAVNTELLLDPITQIPYTFYRITEADAGAWDTFTTRTFSKLNPTDGELYNVTLPLKWEASGAAVSYEYCVDTTDDSICNMTGGYKSVGTSTSVAVKKLTAGTTYYWQVRAKTADADNPYIYANDGNWWMFKVAAKKPAANLFKVSPVDEAVDLVSPVTLTWKIYTGAKEYQYCFFAVDNTDTTPISADNTCIDDESWITAGTALSAAITVAPETTYYWQVRVTTVLPVEVWVYADGKTSDLSYYWNFTTVVPVITPE